MLRIRSFARLAAAALAFSALACQPKPAAFNPEDPAALAEVDAAWRQAMDGAMAVDAGKALSVAAKDKDFTFVTGDVMLVGYDEVLPRFQETYSGLQKQTHELATKQIRLVAPDVAIATAVGEGTYTDKAGFTSEPVGMGATVVFVKKDGQWHAVHFHQSIAR